MTRLPRLKPRTAALLLGIAALSSSFGAQAYKYEFTSESQGRYASFMATQGMWDNGTPDDVGEFVMRTTFSLDEPSSYDDGLARFWGGSVKVELIQGSKTYSAVRGLDLLDVKYDSWAGSLSFDMRTEVRGVSYFTIHNEIGVLKPDESFLNFLKPGFSVSAIDASSSVLSGTVQDDLGVTGWFNTQPSSMTWSTVSAVPEPSTYVLLLAGLAVTIAHATRRRRSA